MSRVWDRPCGAVMCNSNDFLENLYAESIDLSGIGPISLVWECYSCKVFRGLLSWTNTE